MTPKKLNLSTLVATNPAKICVSVPESLKRYYFETAKNLGLSASDLFNEALESFILRGPVELETASGAASELNLDFGEPTSRAATI